MNTKALVEKAKRGLAQGEAGNWEAAEAMAALRDAGWTQRAIASSVGCSQAKVSIYVRAFSYYHGNQKKPEFAEAMAAVRNRGEQRVIPKTPEKRAELAADLLKDKAIADAPIVREATKRAAVRREREAAKVWNKENGIPTRTQQAHDGRRQSTVVNRSFWQDLLLSLNQTARLLREATSELDRTGLPNNQAGEILKTAATVGRDAETFRKRATVRAVGLPMDEGATS